MPDHAYLAQALKPAPGPQFASDNNAGMCPEALAAMLDANAAGHAAGYGDDPWMEAVRARMAEVFETPCDTHLVFNGTAANSLALAHICRPYEATIAHATSHIETDEGGAPEFFAGGSKILLAPGEHGKIASETVKRLATARGGAVHFPKPRALSLSQSTEMGTVYTVDEVGALCAAAHDHGLSVHMDGARLANAAASLKCSLADITWRAGVDVVSFGGTKNGLGLGEAVVWFDRKLGHDFARRVKQGGQLNSKMRLMAAPWLGLLQDETWRKNAAHANGMAQRLHQALVKVPGVEIMFPVHANAVFAKLPIGVQAKVRAKGWRFYTFLPPEGCRLMCAWDTTSDAIERFSSDIAHAAG